MIGGFSAHIRQHIVGYVALFVALAGTATALPGKGTVNTGDIANNTIRSIDVKNDRLRGADIKDDTVSAFDLRENSVGTSEVQGDALTGDDILEETLVGVDAGLVGGIPAWGLGGPLIGETSVPNGETPRFAPLSGTSEATQNDESMMQSPKERLYARNFQVRVSHAVPGEHWFIDLTAAGVPTEPGCMTVDGECHWDPTDHALIPPGVRLGISIYPDVDGPLVESVRRFGWGVSLTPCAPEPTTCADAMQEQP